MKYIEGLMDDFMMGRDTAVTLGKFDGIHLGHQQLIRRICEKKKAGLESVVVTIWPDPKNPALLTKGEKKELLKRLGVSCWIDCPFLPEIAHMSPESFIRDVLVKRLRAKYIAVGEDFRFGYQRKGDSQLLGKMQTELGYELETVPKETYQGRAISSTYIKEALAEGNMELVTALLGYPYTVRGEVLHGRRIGRTLGMPTTNLIPSTGKLLPPNGVYATRTLLDGECMEGITNIGYKPTVGEYFRGVETYLFDYEGDLYGKEIEVQLYSYERPEHKFPNLDELKAQMQRDICFGKAYFNRLTGKKKVSFVSEGHRNQK